MSTVSDADAEWADRFVTECLKRIQFWADAEPLEEPRRTFWHVEWNHCVQSMSFQAKDAYKEEHGREAPLSLRSYIQETASHYLTNPYPSQTVAGRVAVFLRHGIDTPEKYAEYISKASKDGIVLEPTPG